jgi:hypothetical protein
MKACRSCLSNMAREIPFHFSAEAVQRRLQNRAPKTGACFRCVVGLLGPVPRFFSGVFFELQKFGRNLLSGQVPSGGERGLGM